MLVKRSVFQPTFVYAVILLSMCNGCMCTAVMAAAGGMF